MDLLYDKTFRKWAKSGITKVTLFDTINQKQLKQYKNEEYKWGNNIIRKYIDENHKDTAQWTTKLTEYAVKFLLQKMKQKNVRRPVALKSSMNNKTYNVDWETDEYLVEVKARNFTVHGSCGEKILSIPLKYSELPTLTNKNVKIVLVGYQEYELFGFGKIVDMNKCNENAKKILKVFEGIGFEYLLFTDLLEKYCSL